MRQVVTLEAAREMQAAFEAANMPTISLTVDSSLRTKLRTKLVEYRDRIANGGSDGFVVLESLCKAAITEVLLEREMVTPQMALERLVRNYVGILTQELEKFARRTGANQQACFNELIERMVEMWGVIKDYNDTGGKHVNGGTGLKSGVMH